MDKYNRKYKLTIDRADGRKLVVQLPFTVEFDIHRSTLSSANDCTLRVYNLNADSRNQIRKDKTDYFNFRTVTFEAGYDGQTALAFTGNIDQAFSVREGVDMISEIVCYDGGFAFVNGVTSHPFGAGTATTDIITQLVRDGLPNVEIGAIGKFQGTLARGNSYTGNTMERLCEITNGNVSIDNGKLYALSDRECLYTEETPVISPATGLLGTPTREESYINIELLFEPSVHLHQLIDLRSTTAGHLNGTHKIVGIKHRGTISGAVSGKATTTLCLLPGVFEPVQGYNG